MMSHEFFSTGVYYFGDREFKQIANYYGTIIVKPAQSDLFVELTKHGFYPGRSQVACETFYAVLSIKML